MIIDLSPSLCINIYISRLFLPELILVDSSWNPCLQNKATFIGPGCLGHKLARSEHFVIASYFM